MFEEFLELFFLGMATFLSPCSIALMSVYLAYAVGISKSIYKGFIIGCCFAIAMCLAFFFLGYALKALIPVNPASYRFFFAIAGILLVFFGINNLGLFKKIHISSNVSSSFIVRINALKLNALTSFSKYNYAVGAFMFGIVISFALGPCSLALIMTAVLTAIHFAPTPFHGGLLLFGFGLGHALPVIFLSVLLATARKAVTEKTARTSEWLAKIFGIAFVIIGLIMIVYVLGGW